MKYQLYLSGLYYGNIEFLPQGVFHEKLDLFSGETLKMEEITEKDSSFYQAIFNVNMNHLAEALECLCQSLKGKPSSPLVLSTGEMFEHWQKDNPFEEELWVQRKVKYPWDLTVKDGEVVAVTIPSRERVTVLVRKGCEHQTILKQWNDYRESQGDFLVDQAIDVMVPMRDGISLSASVILPKACTEKVPAILVRTPYGKEELEQVYYSFVRRGYAVVVQDVRGRNESEGDWSPMAHELEDGEDTLTWIASQEWSNERVGMIGGSYLGYVQWAAAASGSPYLKALVSVVTAGTAFTDLPRRGGTLSSGTLAWAFALSKRKFMPQLMMRDDWEAVMKIRPLTDICEKALGYPVPFINKWIESRDDCALWQQMDWAAKKEKITVPALILSGWYDDNGMGTTQALDVTKDYPKGKKKVVLGPWVHSGNSSRDIHGVPLGNNALRYDVDLIILKWLDKHLKEIENGIDQTPTVEYYTVGSEKWKTADNWPVPDMVFQELYLSAKGTLSVSPPAETGSDTYRYDPENETPYLVDVSENEFAVPGNYKEVDQRADVLVYETEAFHEAKTITGDMNVEFYGGSDGPDTDWIIKVEDVDLEGNAIKMTDGLLSARYRNGFDKPEFLVAGQIYPFRIRTSKISETILPGHKIRLTITSSASGWCFPNSNTEKGYNSTETRVATNCIYYGGAYPSKVTIPFEE